MLARSTRVATGIGLLLAAATAAPQTPPVPGATLPGRVERDTTPEPRPAPRESGITVDRARFAEQAPPGAGGVRLRVRSVAFVGNEVIPSSELSSLADEVVGREVTLADVFALAARVSALYRERGFVLSQAIVPAQDFQAEAADVKLQILEGFVDQATVVGIPPEALKAYLRPITAERPLRLPTAERQLLLVNELPGLQGIATLKAGSQPASSDLALVVTRRPYEGSFSIHNRIAPSQGDVKLEFSGIANGVFGWFDRHALFYGTSGDKRLNQVAYSFRSPVGADGLTAQIDASLSRSNPDVPVVSNLDTYSDNLAFGFAYPVVRSRQTNFAVRAQLGGYHNYSDSAGFRTSEETIRAVRLGANFDYADAYGGITLIDGEFSKGLSGLGASDPDEPLLNGARPDFRRTTVYVSRLQHLGGDWSLLAAVNAQTSPDQMPPAEQLGLGGEAFLRGYDPSEAIGENGYAAKLELRYTFEARGVLGTLYTFADTGRVKRKQVDAPELRVSLTSAGAGVRFSGPYRTRGYLEIAKPVSDPVASKNSKSARVFAGLGVDF